MVEGFFSEQSSEVHRERGENEPEQQSNCSESSQLKPALNVLLLMEFSSHKISYS